jgi:alkaline phosphatase D
VDKVDRRRFLGLAGLGLLGSACGSEMRRPRGDTADADTVNDTSDDLGTCSCDPLDLADATPLSDVDTVNSDAPAEDDLEVDAGPELDAGQDALGTDTQVDAGPADVAAPCPDPHGCFDPDAWTPLAEAFPYGVQAGDPSEDGARLWTRYLGASPMTLVVFEGEAGVGTIARSHETQVDPTPADVAGAGFATRVVTGLAPGTHYRYAFVTAVGRSAVGHFKTAPARGTRPVVRFTATSCSNYGYRPYRTIGVAAAKRPDFHVLLGDTCYCDGAYTLADYRNLWSTTFLEPNYQALFATCGTFATWDDHEVTNDWNPEQVERPRLMNAIQAFREHLAFREPPLPPLGGGGPGGGGLPPDRVHLWRSQRWGETVEIIVLDCRSERLMSTQHTERAQYLSRAQMDWLRATLATSPCRFKVIVSSVPVTDMPGYFQQVRDRWANYETQRTEILDFIAGRVPGGRKVRGVIWLAGDYHFAALTRIDRAGGPNADRFEIIASPAANAPNAVWSQVLTDDVAQFPFAAGVHNVSELTLDPETGHVLVTWYDGAGAELGTRIYPVD